MAVTSSSSSFSRSDSFAITRGEKTAKRKQAKTAACSLRTAEEVRAKEGKCTRLSVPERGSSGKVSTMSGIIRFRFAANLPCYAPLGLGVDFGSHTQGAARVSLCPGL